MSEAKTIAARVAKQGEKMIEVRIRFWTDDISSEPKTVIPKHAWTSGVVHIQKNETHGITPANPKPFNSLLDLGAVIEKTLKEHGIVLHVSAGMKKYISPRD